MASLALTATYKPTSKTVLLTYKKNGQRNLIQRSTDQGKTWFDTGVSDTNGSEEVPHTKTARYRLRIPTGGYSTETPDLAPAVSTPSLIALDGSFNASTHQADLGYASKGLVLALQCDKGNGFLTVSSGGKPMTDTDGHVHVDHAGVADYRMVALNGEDNVIAVLTTTKQIVAPAVSTPSLPPTPPPAPLPTPIPIEPTGGVPSADEAAAMAYSFPWIELKPAGGARPDFDQVDEYFAWIISNLARPARAKLPTTKRTISIPGGTSIPSDVVDSEILLQRGHTYTISQAIKTKNTIFRAFGSGSLPTLFLESTEAHPAIFNMDGNGLLVEDLHLDGSSPNTVAIAMDNEDCTVRRVSLALNINYGVKLAATSKRTFIEQLDCSRQIGYGIYASEGAEDVWVHNSHLLDSRDQSSIRLNGASGILLTFNTFQNLSRTKGGVQGRRIQDFMSYRNRIWGQMDIGTLDSDWPEISKACERVVFRDDDFTHRTHLKWSHASAGTAIVTGRQVGIFGRAD